MGVSLRSWVTLALLGLLYVLSFADRFILALLVAPLKADLGLSDVQIGLLFGTTFAVFYMVTALPLARVADTRNRKRLIVGGVMLWCLCTMGSSLATGFALLALLRIGLAVGEAALTPSALSLLTDLFPPHRRVFACTVYTCFGMAGSATAYVMGAWVIQLVERLSAAGSLHDLKVWQAAFLAIGLPGVIIGLLVAVIVPEPERHGATVDHPPLRNVWQHVRDERGLYAGLFVGAGFTQLIAYTMVAWAPTYLQRTYGVSADSAGYSFGVAQFFAAVGGTLVVPTLFRHFAATGRARFATQALIALSALGALIIAAAPFLGSATLFLLGHAAGGFLLIGCANMILLLLQPILPPRMRATVTAVALICITGVGLGVGPPLAAMVNHLAAGMAHPMAWGISGSALVGLAGSTIAFLLAAPRLRLALARLP